MIFSIQRVYVDSTADSSCQVITAIFTPTCFFTTTTQCILARVSILDLIFGFHGRAGEFTGVRLGYTRLGTCLSTPAGVATHGDGEVHGDGVLRGDTTDIGGRLGVGITVRSIVMTTGHFIAGTITFTTETR